MPACGRGQPGSPCGKPWLCGSRTCQELGLLQKESPAGRGCPLWQEAGVFVDNAHFIWDQSLILASLPTPKQYPQEENPEYIFFSSIYTNKDSNQFAGLSRYSEENDRSDVIPLKIEDGTLYEYAADDGTWTVIELDGRAAQVFSGEKSAYVFKLRLRGRGSSLCGV